MSKEYLMGNGAIAMGALKAGINLAAGYPGTPSSEIIETLEKKNNGSIHLEWSVNEKAAMEVAAGASYAGARTLVTMKQMGLNVAADPLMCVSYVGVKGGMVVVSADDPGPISSQTEQDTRMFAKFARIPVFDPSSPEDAFEMIQDAYEISEKYHTPVLFRPTTRVCHAYAAIDAKTDYEPKKYEGFVKDSKKWVIFPRLANANHQMIEHRNPQIAKEFSSYKNNMVTGNGELAVLTGGISYAYVKEYLKDRQDVKLIRIATPYPFPDDLVEKALEGVKKVLVIEELSPFLEEELARLSGSRNLSVTILGKHTGTVPVAGELSADIVAPILRGFLNDPESPNEMDLSDMPALPVRPPVLCAGCPHRASFYAVKKAVGKKKAFFCGDIGCYTLGNAIPLDMVDTCLCMGAGITMAQGLVATDKDAQSFAFVGDSTFFASGMTGVANAIYNEANMILCVLDNSTTAMTGHQPHPGTGRNMMGNVVEKISITRVLEGMGVNYIKTVDPLDLEASVAVIDECMKLKGVKAIIFASPCIALFKSDKKCNISDKCINCKKCIREIGCPAIVTKDGAVTIDQSLCNGCGLCKQVCPMDAIRGGRHE